VLSLTRIAFYLEELLPIFTTALNILLILKPLQVHPAVCKLFGFLHRKQDYQELMIAQICAGQSPRKKRKKYELRTERLLEVGKPFDGTDIVGFLRDMSANLEINL